MIFYFIFLNCGQLVNLKICVVGFPRAFWIFGSGSVFCSTDHNWDLKPINPYWHELWKQEKSSSLVPPRVIYFIRLNGLGRVSKQSDWFQFLPPIFYLVFVIKNQLTHPDPKRIGVGKCPTSSQLGLKHFFPLFLDSCDIATNCQGAERECDATNGCQCKSGFKEDPDNTGPPNDCIAGRKSLTTKKGLPTGVKRFGKVSEITHF